jgi:hypothetical protein
VDNEVTHLNRGRLSLARHTYNRLLEDFCEKSGIHSESADNLIGHGCFSVMNTPINLSYNENYNTLHIQIDLGSLPDDPWINRSQTRLFLESNFNVSSIGLPVLSMEKETGNIWLSLSYPLPMFEQELDLSYIILKTIPHIVDFYKSLIATESDPDDDPDDETIQNQGKSLSHIMNFMA